MSSNLNLELYLWPLVITVYDCYEPLLAPVVTEACAEYSDETCGLVMKFVAECAREHWGVN